MRYAIVVERAANNHSAYVPDLPGCIATGVTMEETEQLIREAIELHLSGLREDGLPMPPTAEQIRLRRGGDLTKPRRQGALDPASVSSNSGARVWANSSTAST